MASAILLAGVLAVAVAMVGGAKTSMEARLRMEAALVAEELMGQIAAMDYGEVASLPPVQIIGSLVAHVSKVVRPEDLSGLGVRVRGTLVGVRVETITEEILAEAELFIPEPQS